MDGRQAAHDKRPQTVLFVDFDPTPESYARVYMKSIAALAANVGFENEDVQRWLQELETRVQRDVLFRHSPGVRPGTKIAMCVWRGFTCGVAQLSIIEK